MAFLLAVFTISYAARVCIERPNNVDAAYISSNDIVYSTHCFSLAGKEYCCGDVPEGNIAAVYIVGEKTITQPLSIISSDLVTKIYSEKWATIVVRGEGNFLIIENIDKNYVKRASDIESLDMIIFNMDPVIGWQIQSTKNGYIIYYKVKKGRVPPTLPVVKLAACDLTIKKKNTDVLVINGKKYVHIVFDVFLAKSKIIPPSIKVSINGKEVPVSFDSDMSASVFSPVEGDKALVEIDVSTSLCRQYYKEEIELSSQIPWYLIAIFVVLILVGLHLKLQAR